MKRFEEFESKLDKLIDEFSDLSYSDLADALEYKANECTMKANRE